jgi:hypothetical protein
MLQGGGVIETPIDLAALQARLDGFPEGYFEATYLGRRYGARKASFNNGRSAKLVADELGGRDYISLNLYRLADGRALLKPCEMPEKKVADFILGLEVS